MFFNKIYPRQPDTRIYDLLNSRAPEEEVLRLMNSLPSFDAKHDGGPCLIRAADQGYAKVIEKLLARGADPHFTKNGYWTPLHSASTVEVARLLLDAGADIDAGRATGDHTPLYTAFSNDNRHELVPYLLSRGAQVNQPKPCTSGPLFNAVTRPGGHALVRLLLDKGADVLQTSTNGQYPLNWAQRLGASAETVALLQQRTDAALGKTPPVAEATEPPKPARPKHQKFTL